MSKKFLVSILLSLLAAVATAGEEVTATQKTDELVQEINITADSYSFTPDRIVVQVGVPVVFAITKKGMIPHDLIIDDPASGLSIKERLSGTTDISFTPMNKGTFEFYCGKDLPFLKSHREKGMHGILEVR